MTDSNRATELTPAPTKLGLALELFSSMRFAIALLTLICIASVMGTIVKQHEPLANYVNQFGPFWADVFASIGLYKVYSAWWFLLILSFLVLSTSLCVARNTPKIFADLRTYKQDMREQSLLAFGQRAQAVLTDSPQAAAQRLRQQLLGAGWKVKLQERQTALGSAWMLAAKAGSVNKLGYLAAHSAIVLICLGGLFDGDLIVRAQMFFNGKTPYANAGLLQEVPEQHRLSERNPTFRANLLVAEGTQSSTAVLSQSDGVLLQELPFAVELKKFVVEYYSTGMPKLFASDIVVHDKQSGEKFAARVEVNHPVSYRGIEIYQSSFDDGGSSVRLRAIPIAAQAKAFAVQGVIGQASLLSQGHIPGGELTLEYTGLRVINVENFTAEEEQGVDVRKVNLRALIDTRMGAANKTAQSRHLRNIGPSVSYKLRDAAGQAREFNNYMLPVDTGDGVPVFLWGVRESAAQPFRYLRIPADAQTSLEEFARLHAAFLDPRMREQAVQRYARKAIDPRHPKRAELMQQLALSARQTLALFCGDQVLPGDKALAGLQALSDFIEMRVPQQERSNASAVLLQILQGSLLELAQLARERAGLHAMEPSAKTQGFMTQALLALSDISLYPAPVAFALEDFTQRQASVFQVTRSPGKKLVYLGCALLILGVFAMLYIRERRLWVWLEPGSDANENTASATRATMALSSNRKTMDGMREFEQLKTTLFDVKEHSS